MSTTKPAGWTDERPDENGAYWHSQLGALPELLFVQEGFVFDFGDNEPTSIGFYDGRGKWLGPVYATDFEQLAALREENERLRLRVLELETEIDTKAGYL